MRLYRARHLQLLSECLLRPGQRGVQRLIARLEADLNMVQTGVGEGLQFFLGQPDARGDQVGIETEAARGGDQLRQIFAHQRLAAGKTNLHAAHSARLAKDVNPLFRGQLFLLLREIERVGAIRALQRTAVGQLRQQPQRRINAGFPFSHGR